MGNSEVGHLNIGAGRVVMQDLPRIGDAIATGEIARAPALVDLIAALKASGGTCHLIGLVSPGGVHSHQDHAVALAQILAGGRRPGGDPCADRRPRHAAAIGRRGSASGFVAALPPAVRVATVVGRYYAHGPRQALGACAARPMTPWSRPTAPRFPDPQAAIADAYAQAAVRRIHRCRR